MTAKKSVKSAIRRKMRWERISGGYERNTRTGKIRATTKYGEFGKVWKYEIKKQLRKRMGRK